jgi:hypothetical protein
MIKTMRAEAIKAVILLSASFGHYGFEDDAERRQVATPPPRSRQSSLN